MNFDYLIGKSYEFVVGNKGSKKFKLEFTITKIDKPFLCDVEWQRMESDYPGEYPLVDFDCYQIKTTEKKDGKLTCYEGTDIPFSGDGEIRVYANGKIEIIFDKSWRCKIELK